MTDKETASRDFLDTQYDPTDTPQLPLPTLPFFQFHQDKQVFEFPLEMTNDRAGTSSPLWSGILRDSGLETVNLKHQRGRVKAAAYVLPEINFAFLGEHIYWSDANRKVQGRFKDRPAPVDGSRFISQRLIVGLVQEIEEHAPGTLCFLTISSSQSKYFWQTLSNFDKAILFPAHQARLEKIRQSKPDYPEPASMLFPRYAFWMPLNASEETVNVSTNGNDPNYISTISGNWNPEGESVERLRELFTPADLQKDIRDDHLPIVKRWLTWQESRWSNANAATVIAESPTDVDMETGEIVY